MIKLVFKAILPNELASKDLFIFWSNYYLIHMKSQDFLTISHKGAGNYAPPNTLKAIQKAIQYEADFVEIDVHKTKDDNIVLIHDAKIQNSSGGCENIRDMALEQIKKINVGEGEKIPTLEEVIPIAKNKINLQIEIKAEGMTENLVNLLNQEDLNDSSIISSFSLIELIKLKKKAPYIKIGYLFPAEMNNIRLIKRNITKASKNHFYAVHPHFSVITEEIIQFSKKNNLLVNAWTVNDKNSMMNLIKIGVNGIITDEIMLLKKCLHELSFS